MLKSSLQNVFYTITSISVVLLIASYIKQREAIILTICILALLIISCIIYLGYYSRLGDKEELRKSIWPTVGAITIIVSITTIVSMAISLRAKKELIGPPKFDLEHRITQETIDNHKDDPYGVFMIGYLYHSGFEKMTEPNYEEAFKWFELAASHNQPHAIYYLGLMNYHGYGVKQSYSNARSQFEKAASLELPEAHAILAEMYMRGDGMPKDSMKQLTHTTIAAKMGNGAAQRNLGFKYYLEGKKDSAMHWIHESAKQGYEDAQFLMSWLSINEDLPIDKDDPKLAMYAEGKKTSMKWATILADNDQPAGYHILGLLYSLGTRAEFNFPKSLDYYRKAADKGYENAYLSLIRYYSEGDSYPGLHTDLHEALKWCNVAINSKDETIKQKAEELLPSISNRIKHMNAGKNKKQQQQYTDSTLYRLFLSDMKNYNKDNNFKKLSDF